MTYQEAGQPKEPYRLPEKFASATIHFLYGFSNPSHPASAEAYLADKKYALTADLVAEGLTPEQIEAAVNSGRVKVAPVFKNRISDLYWIPEAEGGLEELAAKARENCGGDGTNPDSPVFGDVLSLGAELDSQQIALAAIAYAANRELIVETTFDRGAGVGNLFVSKDSPLAKLLAEFPDAKPQKSK